MRISDWSSDVCSSDLRNVFDREVGSNVVEVAGVKPDSSEFIRRYEPGHPSADPEGYVLYPNVSRLVEVMDMREAKRSYEANLNVISVAKTIILRTIDALPAGPAAPTARKATIPHGCPPFPTAHPHF